MIGQSKKQVKWASYGAKWCPEGGSNSHSLARTGF
jgi:hypothetical protein